MISSLLGLDGIHFLVRWTHLFFGVVWIGLLYYFNFVQGSYFAEADAGGKSNAIQKLVPRALWWFRWGAMWTFITGLVMISIKMHQQGSSGTMVMASPFWINILSGAFMATLMFLNVWLIIWPNQKIVIANAVTTASGGAANPAAAAAGARSGVASRTNTLFSIPVLFYMVSAMHLQYNVSESSNVSLYWIVFSLIVLAIEGNAIKGKTGPMTTVKGVICCGFILTAVLVVLNSVLI
jgi:uncharacterized membrane protein